MFRWLRPTMHSKVICHRQQDEHRIKQAEGNKEPQQLMRGIV
jgi:hypothetical protein